MNEAFRRRRPGFIGEGEYRQFSVLCPIIQTDQGPSFLYEVRSKNLKQQPGEICFPGGAIEKGESPLEASIRETCEELAISPQQMEIWGPGDRFISPFRFILHPFLGEIKDYKGTFSKDEVSKVFTVPIRKLAENPPMRYKSTIESTFPDDFPYDSVQTGSYYPKRTSYYDLEVYPELSGERIWGMTARITRSMIDLIKKYNLLEDFT